MLGHGHQSIAQVGAVAQDAILELFEVGPDARIKMSA
jgi:hypothetical protein